MGIADGTLEHLHLEQGTEEWHAVRKTCGTASEAPAVLGINPWLPRNPWELFKVKTGAVTVEQTAAMRRGQEMEESARLLYMSETETLIAPAVLRRGRLLASLDGIDESGEVIVEIKTPGSGQESRLWQDVLSGNVPQHYMAQIQQQLLVSGAKHCELVVFDGDAGIIIAPVFPDEEWRQRIIDAWEAFLPCLDAGEPPEPPVVTRDDEAWQKAAAAYVEARQAMEQARQAEAEAREALLALAGGRPSRGCGVKVMPYMKRGPIDYKAIPELKGVDLERYRKAMSEVVRVTLEDQP